MCSVTLHVVSPAGVPMAVGLGPDDTGEQVMELVSRAERFAAWLTKEGWEIAPARGAGQGPSAQELAQGPRFCGFPCSPTVDDRGLPTWIVYEGRQATRREKQGDVWFSYRAGEEYVQVLRIPKGEKTPAVEWPGQGS